MYNPQRAGRRPGALGFTLIELMVAVAVIAIIAAIAIPNLIEARKGSNEAAAIGALRTLVTAQALFREGDKDGDGVLDYAASLDELAAAGLIDNVLGSGMKQGYTFTIGGAAVFNWSGTADPVTPGKSGDRYFFVDESGVIRFNHPCPPGTVPVKDSQGKITCMPKIVAAGGAPEVHGTVAVETLQIAHEGFLDPAKDLARDPAFARSVLEGLDADGDGKLTFAEVLDGDILQLTRKLALAGGEPIGDDAWLAAVLKRFQAGLNRSLELGPSETALPAVQVDGLRGHPAEFLELVAADPKYASLGVLHGLLLQLQESDMTGGSDRQRQQLIDAAEGLHDLLRFGQVRELERRLEWIGDRSRAWVAEPAGSEIAQSVEQSLRLITAAAR
jgi:type IV pilus assembly protein PilA